MNYDIYSKVNSLILGAVAGAAIFTAFMQMIVPGKKEKKGEGLSSKVRKGVIYALSPSILPEIPTLQMGQ